MSNDQAQHTAFDRLVDVAEGRLAAPAVAAVQSHLASCGRCASDLAWINRTLSIMSATTLEEPPPEVVSRAARMLAQRAAYQAPARSLVERILATLRFDTAQASPQSAFGLRSSGQRASRQLLFAAADREIQLRMQPHRDSWSVAGQILGTCVGGGAVELRGPAHQHISTLSEVCEFNLDGVLPGQYQLVIGLDEQVEVEVSDLTIG